MDHIKVLSVEKQVCLTGFHELVEVYVRYYISAYIKLQWGPQKMIELFMCLYMKSEKNSSKYSV